MGKQGKPGGRGQHSRGEGVQATGFQLQQAVPPVGPGHAEIVHGASEDPEGGVLQHEVPASDVQPGLPLSQPGGEQTAPVQPTGSKGSGQPRGGPAAGSRATAGDGLLSSFAGPRPSF